MCQSLINRGTQAFVYAQQSQAAMPTTNAQGARQWIAAWRSKVAQLPLHMGSPGCAVVLSYPGDCACSPQEQS